MIGLFARLFGPPPEPIPEPPASDKIQMNTIQLKLRTQELRQQQESERKRRAVSG